MDAIDKPKHQLLQEFAVVLLRRNPMQVGQENPLEYEAEALSILSRFNEAALQLPDDEAAVAQVATSIVKQSLEFWFEDIGTVDPEPIARDLLAVFRSGFGDAEPVLEGEVIEEPNPAIAVTIGG